MTKEEIIAGLRVGRHLRCDRRDEPLLPWLMAHPNVEARLIEQDEQSSVMEFAWKELSK